MADIKSIVEPLTRNIHVRAPIAPPGGRLFRARSILDEVRPRRLADLSYPPSDHVSTYQRVNPPGRPVFYCSESLDVSLSEVCASNGKMLAISTWTNEKQLILTSVGFAENCLRRLTGEVVPAPAWQTNAAPTELSPLTKEEDEINHRVTEFLGNQFCIEVQPGEEHLYKVSVAISEVLGFDPASDGHFEKVGDDRHTNVGGLAVDGIVYPSIKCRTAVHNVALRPHSVDTKLRFLDVRLVRVVNAGMPEMQLDEVDFANSINSAGEFEWKGRPRRFSTKKSGDVIRLTKIGENRWNVTDGDGNPVDPD
jgi:hypothetical protein